MKKLYTPRIGSATERILWHLADQPDGKEVCTANIRGALGSQSLPVFQLLIKSMEHNIVVGVIRQTSSGPMYHYTMRPEHKPRFKQYKPEPTQGCSKSLSVFQDIKPQRKDLEILIRNLHEAKTNVGKHIAMCDLFEAINLKPPGEVQDFAQLKRVPVGFTSSHHVGRSDGGSFAPRPTQYFDLPLFLE